MGDYGTRIKAAREAAQLTQEQLGEKVGVTGVTIMRYEKNQREPRLKQLFAIAAALGVSPAYLMGCMNNDGSIDLGLVAIELSRVFGIDRVIVYDALIEIGPEDPFTEQSIKEIKEKAKSLEFSKSMQEFLVRSGGTKTGSFSMAEQIEWSFSYEAQAAAEILNDLKKLNELGQKEAVKRIGELTEIPKYQKQEGVDKQ